MPSIVLGMVLRTNGRVGSSFRHGIMTTSFMPVEAIPHLDNRTWNVELDALPDERHQDDSKVDRPEARPIPTLVGSAMPEVPFGIESVIMISRGQSAQTAETSDQGAEPSRPLGRFLLVRLVRGDGLEVQRLDGIASPPRDPGTTSPPGRSPPGLGSIPVGLQCPDESVEIGHGDRQAECPLRLTGDLTFSRKCTHTPALVLAPKVNPSSTNEARTPTAVHHR